MHNIHLSYEEIVKSLLELVSGIRLLEFLYKEIKSSYLILDLRIICHLSHKVS